MVRYWDGDLILRRLNQSAIGTLVKRRSHYPRLASTNRAAPLRKPTAPPRDLVLASLCVIT